jgi:hypothetical protein
MAIYKGKQVLPATLTSAKLDNLTTFPCFPRHYPSQRAALQYLEQGLRIAERGTTCPFRNGACHRHIITEAMNHLE